MAYYVTVSAGQSADRSIPFLAVSDPIVVGDVLQVIGAMVDRAASRQGGIRETKEAKK